MLRAVRKELKTIVVAVIASAVTAGAPAVAHGVHAAFAHNADKVDNKHAVGSGATTSARKGKLVATSATTGRLPNNIISKALDANKLDGIDSANLLPGGVLPRGVTIRGHYATLGRSDGTNYHIASHDLSFGYKLASAPTVQVIRAGAPATENCPGNVNNPTAAPGYLCVYENDSQNKRDNSYPHVGVGFAGGVANSFGAWISTQSNNTTAGFFWSRGTWAVTAP